jgi:hypothetical protein
MITGNRGGDRAARVRRTGLAKVHAGEIVLARAGTEAQAEAVAVSDRSTIHYHFPVEIEVIVGARAIDPNLIAERALELLLHGLEGAEEA